MVAFLTKHPILVIVFVLVQGYLIGHSTPYTIGRYWATLDFLLADPFYVHSSVIAVCFAIAGLDSMDLLAHW